MSNNTPVVVVAYNRERSLQRLLHSIELAAYPNSNIELIISIDRAENNENIVEIANQFRWNHGPKKVIYQEKNLGLRKHILKCGDLSLKYGSVIILEDDLFVSPNFYNYATKALEFCEGEARIGGISLYNHQLNVHTRDNFLAIDDGYDNWYFQFASSWGQCWNAAQWKDFMDWYYQNPVIGENSKVPAYVRSWSEKSWLKYNITYLVEKDKYFFYPRISLTTNFSDAGTHVGNDSTVYQVPILNNCDKQYNFSKIGESQSVYDAFYESKTVASNLGVGLPQLLVDLHGYHQEYRKPYVLSSQLLNFKVIKSFSKSLKPIDANVKYGLEGNEIFLYDTNVKEHNPHKKDLLREIIYNFKHIPPKSAFFVYLQFWKMRITRVFKKVGQKRR